MTYTGDGKFDVDDTELKLYNHWPTLYSLLGETAIKFTITNNPPVSDVSDNEGI